MNNHANRLAKVERVLNPADDRPWAWGVMDYDEYGNNPVLQLSADYRSERKMFTGLPGESEDELCERAMQEMTLGDRNLLLHHVVRPAAHGGLAPGFERFAKQ